MFPPCFRLVCTLRLLLVEQWDLAAVAVVAAHLALAGVDTGGVGVGVWGQVVGIRGVSRGRQQGLGLVLATGGTVVVVLGVGGAAAASQRLTLGQLVS